MGFRAHDLVKQVQVCKIIFITAIRMPPARLSSGGMKFGKLPFFPTMPFLTTPRCFKEDILLLKEKPVGPEFPIE